MQRDRHVQGKGGLFVEKIRSCEGAEKTGEADEGPPDELDPESDAGLPPKYGTSPEDPKAQLGGQSTMAG